MIRSALFVLLLIWMGTGRSTAAQPGQPLDSEAKIEMAAQVLKIFSDKCVDCHGSHLPKPKGKFGYVLDLKRVAGNPDYIVPGDPKESELYQLVKNEEMPGEDADVPPLTADEKKTVERWVLAGAPSNLPANAVPPVSGELRPAASRSFLPRLINWLGKFHAVSTHFPIARLLTAVFAEALAWWLQRSEWMFLVRFLVVLGALSSIPAAVLGWCSAFPLVAGTELATVYRFHQILGTAASAWALVCGVLVCMAECEEGSPERRRFRGALLLGAFLIAVVGFLGGALSAGGLDHYKF